LNYGQRVQQSVFECVVSEAQYEELKHALLSEIDEQVDSLRLYKLQEVLGSLREVFGQFRDIDYKGPLVV
jgi:CRISPR-associated protein Cas2